MAEGPRTVLVNADISNYMKLQIFLHKSNKVLREVFVAEWKLRTGTDWEDSYVNRKDFTTGLGRRLYENSERIQKECLSSRNITEWDLPLLIQCVKSLNADIQYDIFHELKSIRNKLAHLGELQINDKDYADYQERIQNLLLKIGLSQEDIDQVEIVNVPETVVIDPKVKKLRDLGNEAFKTGMYEESIECYTNAICTPGVPNKELAVLYSNRSIAFLRLNDITSAKEDATGSIHLNPAWWKGYYRLAAAYKAKENWRMAVKNLLLAQQLHDDPMSLDKEINLLIRIINQQKKETEDFQLEDYCKPYEEMDRQIRNFDPKFLKFSDSAGLKAGGASAMNTMGHMLFFGRDGIQPDRERAAEYFRKSAAQGETTAMLNLAIMTINGRGVEQNFSEGIRRLEELASQPKYTKVGDIPVPDMCVSEAEYLLGTTYEEGRIIQKDYEKAKYWYNQAIYDWSHKAAYNMSFMHSRGKGVPTSMDLAIQYLKLGAGMGGLKCMENLVYKYFGLKDFENMQRWHLYAVENGSEVLKLESALKFQNYFKETITNNFNKEKFTEAIWREVESGPLKDLINLKVKDFFHRLNYKAFDKFSSLPGRAKYKIDSSTPYTYKKSITVAHREEFNDAGNNVLVSFDRQTNLKSNSKPIFDLLNLKPIYLEEMGKKNQDHIYENHVLKLTIMEDPIGKTIESGGISSVVHDERSLYQRLFIFNYSPTKKELQENLGFGSKISIVNPYYRIAMDGSPSIRVDDFNTVFVHSKLKNDKICRYCGNENYEGEPIPCRNCKRCYYCSKKCLKLDCSELKHKLVCKKRI